MNNSTYLIYKHTSPSGKSYIGQTNNLKYRTWRHKRKSSTCSAFYNAIQKYGWESFTTEILAENLTIDQANEKEQEFIILYNTLSPNGYNLTTGGLGYIRSDETKRKISQCRKGKSRSEETKQKISQSKKGICKSPETVEKMKLSKIGKMRSAETKQKISDTLSGRSLSDEHKQNIRNSNIGKKHTAESIEKMRLSKIGKPRSEETKQKIRESLIKRNQS